MITVSENNAIKIVSVESKIVDAKTAGAIRETIAEMVPQNRQFVLDLSQTNLVDSGGLAGIVMLHKFLNGQQCQLVLCGLSKAVVGLFKLTRMDRLFDLQDDIQSSVKALESKA
ncbi:STAS domain-containing protein [Limnobacter parvus]|uniref:STAS domain-containing protein n=1 Tax=Limnobacter parvus TaxID=2939690 RepID=A0ABT1XM41_9BURK|nr:STAS domain-containing protein [Limnobacter parvus]MCR2747603.1 STAS domain-containing protein [Limnobacter parvus]